MNEDDLLDDGPSPWDENEQAMVAEDRYLDWLQDGRDR